MLQNINSLILVFSVLGCTLFIQFFRISSLHVKRDKLRVYLCYTPLIIKISSAFRINSEVYVQTFKSVSSDVTGSVLYL